MSPRGCFGCVPPVQTYEQLHRLDESVKCICFSEGLAWVAGNKSFPNIITAYHRQVPPSPAAHSCPRPAPCGAASIGPLDSRSQPPRVKISSFSRKFISSFAFIFFGGTCSGRFALVFHTPIMKPGGWVKEGGKAPRFSPPFYAHVLLMSKFCRNALIPAYFRLF